MFRANYHLLAEAAHYKDGLRDKDPDINSLENLFAFVEKVNFLKNVQSLLLRDR